MTVCRPNAHVVNHLRVERTCSTRCMSNICCLTYQNPCLSLRKPSSGLIRLILLLLGLLGHTFTSSGSTLSLSLTGETTDEKRNKKIPANWYIYLPFKFCFVRERGPSFYKCAIITFQWSIYGTKVILT